MPLNYQPPLSLTTDFSGLLDGNFDFWDVATTFAVGASDSYTADMWIANAGTGGTATVSQNIPLIGSEPPWMTRPRKYRYQYQQTVAASTTPTIGQKLSGVALYNGNTIILSGTFSSATANAIASIRVTQNFGTGGTPSASIVTTQSINWSLSNNESFQSISVVIPSISGKTLGTNGDDYIRFDLLLMTGAVFTLTASQIQIDNNGALPFRYRGRELESIRVEPYLYVIGPVNNPLGFVTGFNNSTNSAVSFLPLPITMRANPAISMIGGAITSNGYTTTGALVTGTVPNITSLSKNVIQFNGNNTANNWGVGYANYFAAGSPSSLVLLDARL